MRFNKLWFLIFSLAFSIAACSSGDSPALPESPLCATNIYDENFTGPYRAVFGFGEGAQTALRLALADPERFNAVVALDGPTNARTLLWNLDQLIADFDNWPESPSREKQIAYWRDLMAAFGNVLYNDDNSNFYAPGLNADDFVDYQDKQVPGLISPENPTGSHPCVSVQDVSGIPIEWLVAVDLNDNGTRDAGEPIVSWLHEPFTDANGNGRYDQGENFSDVGIDGVANTDDYGEGNGDFDLNPRFAAWLQNDPYEMLKNADLDLTPGYRQSIYLDSLKDSVWGYGQQIGDIASLLEARLEQADGGTSFCIENILGRYTSLQGEFPLPLTELWFAEKYVYLQLNGSDDNVWADKNEGILFGRWAQALSFISMRMPNGLRDNVPKESSAIWQVSDFYSSTFAASVRFGIGFPAGYFDSDSAWKSYPVIYVFHDRESTISDWYKLLIVQGDQANRKLLKQAIIIVVDGTRGLDENYGYNYYIDQAAPEIGGGYGSMIDELMEYVESTFRVQTKFFERDDEDDDN